MLIWWIKKDILITSAITWLRYTREDSSINESGKSEVNIKIFEQVNRRNNIHFGNYTKKQYFVTGKIFFILFLQLITL